MILLGAIRKAKRDFEGVFLTKGVWLHETEGTGCLWRNPSPPSIPASTSIFVKGASARPTTKII